MGLSFAPSRVRPMPQGYSLPPTNPPPESWASQASASPSANGLECGLKRVAAHQTASMIYHSLGARSGLCSCHTSFPSPQSQSSHWKNIKGGGAELDTDAPSSLRSGAGCREGQRLRGPCRGPGRAAQSKEVLNWLCRIKGHSRQRSQKRQKFGG